jgi:hypothetical protein
MTYQTAFDVIQNGYTGWSSALTALLPALAIGGFILAAGFRARKATPSDPKWKIGLGAIAMGLLFSAWIIWTSYAGYQSLASRLREGRFHTVEGTVENYGAGGSSGKYFESFSVAGHQFSYYGSDMSGYGFHQLARQDGPIRNGLHVRIAYSGSVILRLEIAS